MELCPSKIHEQLTTSEEQVICEAAISLLTSIIVCDGEYHRAEIEKLHEEAATLPWNSKNKIEDYYAFSMREVSAIRGSHLLLEHIKAKCELITNKQIQAQLIEAAVEIAKSDGEASPSELYKIEKMKEAFNLAQE